MALDTYAALQLAISDWMGRNKPDNSADPIIAARAADLIRLYEARVRREYRCLDMERVETLAVAGNPTTLPTGFIEMRNVWLLGSPRHILNYRPDGVDLSATGSPTSYAIQDGKLMVWPVPTSATLQIEYWRFVPLALADGGSNWLLDYHPDLYLFGSLIEGQSFVDDPPAIEGWTTRYNQALKLLPSGNWRRTPNGTTQPGGPTQAG